jgi:hypothetical protein
MPSLRVPRVTGTRKVGAGIGGWITRGSSCCVGGAAWARGGNALVGLGLGAASLESRFLILSSSSLSENPLDIRGAKMGASSSLYGREGTRGSDGFESMMA